MRWREASVIRYLRLPQLLLRYHRQSMSFRIRRGTILKVKIEGGHFSTGYFHLFNALGQEVLKQVIFVGTEVSQFSLSAFDDGIYFYKIVMDGKEQKSGKVVVNRG